MKVKGKRIIGSESAAEFANTIRGQYVISQALTMAVSVLRKYEDEESALYNIKKAEPSNRNDMELLLKAFPLYMIHDNVAWNVEDFAHPTYDSKQQQDKEGELICQ